MKKTVKHFRTYKKSQTGIPLQLLTCYDFQTAQLLKDLPLDMLLVGDSLAQVMLGLPSTIPIDLGVMEIFASAVKRGAPQKFVILDIPFGVCGTFNRAIKQICESFQRTQVEAVKIEGSSPIQLKIIERLIQIGIPVMGHMGLTPQFEHQMGGFYTHGKNNHEIEVLHSSALKLQEAGCFALVLECVESTLAESLTQNLAIPTIGIGSGANTDGQILVINDLLGMSDQKIPHFVKPVINLFEAKKKALLQYLTPSI